MRDLFGSTNFIKFGVVETILSSSDAVNRLLHGEEDEILEEGYTLDDYLSNLDSYLYGLVFLPIDEESNAKTWIRNYIMYLYIPLIEKDSLYVLKSRFVSEIFKLKNGTSRIDNSIKDYILSSVYSFLENAVSFKEDELQLKLKTMIDDELFLEYLLIYYDIFENKDFIKDIYIDNEELRSDMNSLFDFLK